MFGLLGLFVFVQINTAAVKLGLTALLYWMHVFEYLDGLFELILIELDESVGHLLVVVGLLQLLLVLDTLHDWAVVAVGTGVLAIDVMRVSAIHKVVLAQKIVYLLLYLLDVV